MALHAQVETLVPILEPAFSRDDYIATLSRFHGFYAGVEAQTGRHAEITGSLRRWMDDRRLKWLEADLRFLGYNGAAIASLPVCHRLPALKTRESLLGAAYVFEGSSLGSHIICRNLRRLGVEPGAGATFFHAYGDSTGDNWKEFTTFFCEETAFLNESAVIDSAVAVFEVIRGWLSGGEEISGLANRSAALDSYGTD